MQSVSFCGTGPLCQACTCVKNLKSNSSWQDGFCKESYLDVQTKILGEMDFVRHIFLRCKSGKMQAALGLLF